MCDLIDMAGGDLNMEVIDIFLIVGDRSRPQIFDPTVFQKFVFCFVEWLAPDLLGVQDRCSAHRKTLRFTPKNLEENLASGRAEKCLRRYAI